ncbi:sugar porter family MFS transporter [Legionella sp. CNM-4043-24]|uniref:sugar porter family MFS transporter n=1 Tax=Legionella sp. CNM-4043-24 TaxID=3421646 RepID=UPI00403AF784
MKEETNGFVLLVAVIAGFGGFLFGYDSSVVADMKDQVMQQLSLTDWQWSKIVSFSLLGAVFGIPLSGMISDRLSRRTLLILVALGFIAGTALCALANDLNTLLWARVLIGVCMGIASYVTPLFIAEIAPPAKRGALLLINGLAITFGQAIAFLSGYFLHDTAASSWRLLLWIGILPALILFFGMFWAPHSPRWILQRYGEDAALRVLKRIRASNADVMAEMAEITSLPVAQTSWRQLFKVPVVFVLLVGMGLGVFQQFSGISAIMYYGPVIFKSAGFASMKNAILATFGMGLINFAATAFTLLTVDRFGRRALLLHGTFIAALGLFAVAALFYWNVPNLPLSVFMGLSCYVIGYCISVGSLFWVIVSEIYPMHVRGLAMSMATVTLWGANFLVSISFLELYQTAGESLSFMIFGGICLLACAFVYRFVPETMGVSLEKIEDNLAAGLRMRDLGRVIDTRRHKKQRILTLEEPS